MARRREDLEDFEECGEECEEISEENQEIPEEFVEFPDENDEILNEVEENVDEREEPQELVEEDPEKQAVDEMEKPDVEWIEDIEKIEDQSVKEKEIENAREIVEFDEDLKNKRESGEITEKQFETDHEEDLVSMKRKATTRSFLASKGFYSEKHGDMFERLDDRELPLSQRDIKEKRIREAAEEVREDDMEELADRLLEEHKISERTRENISKAMKKGRK